MSEDKVNHPKHYNAHPAGVECITVTEHMNFNVGNAVKYLWRADLKDSALEDLKKAAWYVGREIERREKARGEDYLVMSKDSPASVFSREDLLPGNQRSFKPQRGSMICGRCEEKFSTSLEFSNHACRSTK